MSALPKAEPQKAEPYMSTEEYFALETVSPFRHELVGGVMYAMAGGSDAHEAIETNLIGLLHSQLRGKQCRVSGGNMKLKLFNREIGEDEYVYADAMICCDPADGGHTDGHAWRERPAALFEVLSRTTRAYDESTKRPAYLRLSSLEAFLRIEQTHPEVILDRRLEGKWQQETVTGLDAIITLPFVGVTVSLADLYEGVQFPA